MKIDKKNIIWVIIIILMIGVLGYWQSTKSVRQDTYNNVPLKDDSNLVTSDWKTYIDKEYGYEYSYPNKQNFIISSKDIAFAMISGKITDANGKLITLAEYLKYYNYYENYNKEDITFNGILWLKFISKDDQSGVSIRYITVRNDIKYEFVLNLSRKINLNDKILMDDIVKTFRFTSVPPKVTSTKPSITVLSPNGGEVWKIGSQQIIKWKTTGNIPPNYRIYITIDNGGITGLGKVSINSNEITFKVPQYIVEGGDMMVPIKTGLHKIKIYLFDGIPNTGYPNPDIKYGKRVLQDESDNNFTITN